MDDLRDTNGEKKIIDEETQQELLDKFDRDSVVEKTDGGKLGYITDAVAAFMSLYIIYTCGFGAPEAMLHRATFMLMCLPLVFLIYPAKKSNKGFPPKWYDYAAAGVSIAICLYMMIQHNAIIQRNAMATSFEKYLFAIAVLVILEAVRRVASLGMVCIIGVFLAYAYVGKYLPGVFAHPGITFGRMASYLLLTAEGIFGSTVGTAAGMVGLFIIFASFMEKTGVGRFINNFAFSLTGSSAGGPAKVSVVTSALFGTISGNAVSNVVTTGAFTIPLMKKTGYQSEFAGAVEAVSSTAGQLMPPIMGASAFIMADITGIAYSKICIAAIVPVLLYYAGCFTMVHLRAKKLDLKGLPKEELPKLRNVILKEGYLAIPFIFVVTMLMMRYTVTFVGFLAIPLCVIIAALKKETRLNIKDIIGILAISGKRLLSIGAVCGGISMIMAVCNLTGITQTLSSMIIKLAGGNFFITLILIAVICIVMGMGLPTVSVYMLLSTVAAPALIMGFDVPVLAAHFFVFYFGLLANVTPPVAIPAYAAAGLADSNPSKTGWQAFRLALGGYLVPFIFIVSPDLLFIHPTYKTAVTILTSIAGVVLLSSAVEGWLMTRMKLPQRVLAGIVAALMVVPESITDIIGIVFLCILIFVQVKERNVKISEYV
ncbi:TRAP transporter permease [Clostridium sp. AM58-1XD]|uniref:TRAP transporter permease n=1 Tax=Clostridium sp. AM58-1XD TaxID=2292307 RepID=UPI000E51ABE3|nr:TRAP transporter permease [Clostridium sp. AM58-1XD]RGY98872.1 TRAP transporter permease [Clostridium sp. AM58-1XD]